jgi:hypothetical protein
LVNAWCMYVCIAEVTISPRGTAFRPTPLFRMAQDSVPPPPLRATMDVTRAPVSQFGPNSFCWTRDALPAFDNPGLSGRSQRASAAHSYFMAHLRPYTPPNVQDNPMRNHLNWRAEPSNFADFHWGVVGGKICNQYALNCGLSNGGTQFGQS